MGALIIHRNVGGRSKCVLKPTLARRCVMWDRLGCRIGGAENDRRLTFEQCSADHFRL